MRRSYTVAQALAGVTYPVQLDGEWYMPIAFFPNRQRVILVKADAEARLLTDTEWGKVIDAQTHIDHE